MKQTTRRALGAAMALGLSLSLAACAEDSSNGNASGSGEGVAYGADKATWQKAFADVDTITVNAQSSAAKGSPVGKMYDDYFAAVEDYSDGKITFEIAYSNAVAEPLDVDDALRDGRLDMGNINYVYEADQYPANAALGDASFVGEQAAAINPLMLHGAMNVIALESDEVRQELDENGLVPILPWFSGDANGIQCVDARSTAADFKGVPTVAAGRVNALELGALGASPTSLPYSELYEALQRKTVSCSLNSLRVANLMGLFDVAPHFTIDDEVGLSKTPGGWLVSKDFWEELPLVAQQLLFDQSRVILKNNIEGSTKFQVDGLTAILDNKGSISSFDDAARKAVSGAHEKALDDMRKDKRLEDGNKLVDDILSKNEEWAATVEGLGFSADTTFAQWPAEYAKGYDIEAYLDTVYEAFEAHRPS